jgi:type II secretory pathway pseudopilin PulG
MKSEKGFTLFELILALVLTGLLVAMVGTGVVSGFNLFAASRENTHLTQKANLALARLTRELREITNLVTVNAAVPYLIYEHADTTSAIAQDGDTIKLFADVGVTNMNAAYIAANGDVLIDGITAFSLSYWNGTNAWQTSPAFDPIRELSAIEFQFAVDRDTLGGRDSTFGNTVHLRNNNNYGGAVLAVVPPDPPTLGSYPCFIATATASSGTSLWPPLSIFSILMPILRVLRGWTWRSSPESFLKTPRRLGSRGAALIAAIGVLVVFSALALVMLPMITTSQYTQLGQETTSKTYYLAESGYRYAASQYLNAGSYLAKNSALENLHGQTFTLAGNAGSFHLEVFPYYGYVATDPGGGSTLRLTVPGDLPGGLGAASFSHGGRLKIGSSTFSYNSATTSSPHIDFNMDATMPSIPANSEVFFVARTTSTPQTVVQGGNITMAANSTLSFPPTNAEVVIDGNVYAYRTNDQTNHKLMGITDPEDDTMPALSLAADTDVQLSKYVDLESTGSYGSGSLASQRLLTYHTPLPNTDDSLHRLEFHDTFEDLSHWKKIWGTQAVEAIDSDSAMRVTDVDWASPYPKVSLTALDWTATEIDLEWIHQRGDYFLSYDTQVKIGFIRDGDDPPWGYTPPNGNIPTYFSVGLSFRLDDNDASHNAYGLSFMRGNRDLPSPYDNIPDEIVPVNDLPLIVLWQQANDGGALNWLAYKQIGGLVVFSEDVEGSVAQWTASGLWNVNENRAYGGARAWYYGQDELWDYDTGGVTSGELISPEIDLDICEYDERLVLNFWSWHSTETQDPDNNDVKAVDIRTFDGSGWGDWIELERLDGDSSSGWEHHEIDLRSYLGQQVQLRFHFDSVTAGNNDFEGWYVDDIEISGNWPRVDSTLAVRLQEAPSLEFDGGGTHAIQPGDLISQSTASAEVDAAPILTAGTWAGGNAAGHLVLKNLTGSFVTNQPFFVVGVGQTGTVRGVRSRDNFIRVYFGSATGCGIPNSDPLDNERSPYPRNPDELIWPPADGEPYTPDVDTFTLIEWDAINSNVTSLAQLTASQLRSNETDLLTPEGPLGQTRPEIGLHALGHGATKAYFDDFGLTVTFDGPVDITSPVQE